MSSSVSMSKIFKAVTDARAGDAEVARLCVVGAGPELTRVARALSAGAADERGGISAALDALPPAEFPRDARLAVRSLDESDDLAPGVAHRADDGRQVRGRASGRREDDDAPAPGEPRVQGKVGRRPDAQPRTWRP